MAVIYTSPTSPVGADIRPGVINSEDDLWLFRVPIAAPQLFDGIYDSRSYDGTLIPRWEEDPETGNWVTVQRDLFGVAPVGQTMEQITYAYGGEEYFITQFFYVDPGFVAHIVAAVLTNAAGQVLGAISGNVFGSDTASIGLFTGELRNEFGELVGTWGVDEPWSTVLSGNDLMSGSAQGDTFFGSAGDDTLFGEAGADTLSGGAGDDTLDGGLGADLLDGGEGRDLVDYSTRTQAVRVTLNGATAASVSVNGTPEDTLLNVENVLGGSAADVLVGDALTNILIGGGGNDTLIGAGGADILLADDGNDRLDGGDGIDRVDFVLETTAAAELSATGVRVTLNGATAAQATFNGVAADTLLNIEQLIGSVFNDTLVGDGGANLLFGFLGDDTLEGGNGDDSLVGGEGVDVLNGGAGTDTASFEHVGSDPMLAVLYDAFSTSESIAVTLVGASAANFTRAGVAGGSLRNIENVVGGLGADTLVGDGLANRLEGLAAADTLNGQAGNDSLLGGEGDDSLGGGIGQDVLVGGAGADWLDGGADLDTADFSAEAVHQNPLFFGPPAGVSVTLTGANPTVASTGDTLLNIENLIGTALGYDTLIGDDFANTLSGLGGVDVLAGGAGADVLDGGTGLDTADYSEKVSAVIVTLNRAVAVSVSVGGTTEDSLRNIENVTGGSGADRLTGDAASNLLTGAGGNDTLVGGAGNDVLVGGDGNDALDGGLGRDTVYLFDRTGPLVLRLSGTNVATVTHNGVAEDTVRSVESVYGGNGNDTFTGDALANTLSGGGGNDRLNGLLGSDVLEGGAGLDRFYFSTALGPTNVDTLRGFEAGTDKIHLSRAIFTSLAGQNAGAVLSSNFFALDFAADANDYIIFDTFNKTLYYDADGSGVGAEVVVARIFQSGGNALAASDFILA